jgi:ankyrin repeat protein
MRFIMLQLRALIFALVISLTSSFVEGQEVNCDGWVSEDEGVAKPFWQYLTPEGLSKCLEAGFKANARSKTSGFTPLHQATYFSKDTEVIGLLLESGASVNSRDLSGHTPLFYAAFSQNLGAIELLLSANADVNSRGEAGWAALDHTVRVEFYDVMLILLRAGADPNAKVSHDTPMFRAVKQNHKEIVLLLIGYGADVNAPSGYDDHSPLHQAVVEENKEIIMLLLEAGADGTAIDKNEHTPFDLARDSEALKGTDVYWILNEARFE